MAEKTASRFSNAFLRSRIWPVIIMVILFSGMLSITGYILWQTRLKEEFSLEGRLESSHQSSQNGGVDLLLILENQQKLPLIEPGVTVVVNFETPDRIWHAVNTTLVRQVRDSMTEQLVLKPYDGSFSEDVWFNNADDKSRRLRLKLVVRQKRLIREIIGRRSNREL